MRRIFIVLTGVSGNLGDAVIRRRVLEWARGTGEIHAYVGKTTPGWVEQLGMRDDEKVYGAGTRREWVRELVLGRGKRALVFDPGEVPLGRAHLKSELFFVALTALVRLRGGVVVRPPRAVADYTTATGTLHRISSAWSQFTLWRSESSFRKMRTGILVPDTAFDEPRVSGLPVADRDKIVISLRGKRSVPPEAWFIAVRDFAKEAGLSISIMSQVDEDEERSALLAERLGAGVTYVPWGERSDLEQEIAVRKLYESAAFVISDRLHVLILSAQAGAVPIEIVERPVPKVAEHFAVAGITGVTKDISGLASDEILEFLRGREAQRASITENMDAARARLDAEIARIRASLKR